MSEHTPLPWEVFDSLGTRCVPIAAHGQDEQGRRVTHFVAICNSATQDNQGNARFIVRACIAHADLLAACKAAVRYDDLIRACANDPAKMASACTAQGDDLDALYDDWIRMARAAIAKAEGA